MAKIKNIYRETYKGRGVVVAPPYLPKIQGYKVKEAFITVNGTDLVDGEEEPFVMMKIYMQEDK